MSCFGRQLAQQQLPSALLGAAMARWVKFHYLVGPCRCIEEDIFMGSSTLAPNCMESTKNPRQIYCQVDLDKLRQPQPLKKDPSLTIDLDKVWQQTNGDVAQTLGFLKDKLEKNPNLVIDAKNFDNHGDRTSLLSLKSGISKLVQNTRQLFPHVVVQEEGVDHGPRGTAIRVSYPDDFTVTTFFGDKGVKEEANGKSTTYTHQKYQEQLNLRHMMQPMLRDQKQPIQNIGKRPGISAQP